LLTWTAVDPYVKRRERVTAVVMALLAVMVVGALVVALVVTRRPVVAAGDGIGDPYVPTAGGWGYDVGSYAVDVRFDPASGRLEGRTTVTLTPRMDLATIHLDLALTATSVVSNGVSLSFSQTGTDLAISAPTPPLGSFREGSAVSLVISYEGRPIDVRLGGEGAVYVREDETLIAGEPDSAPVWFPANEHPSDPATYTFTVSVPEGYQAICAGALLSHDVIAGRDVWRWAVTDETVTYATMLAAGHYDIATEQARIGDRTVSAVYAVSRLADEPARAMRWLRESPQAATTLTRWLGPYPIATIGGIVPGVDPWWGGLEISGRPIYHPQTVGSRAVLHHELAHMWLGDTVTLQRWDDLFINESLTSYAEWLAEEADGRASVEARFTHLYDTSKDSFWRQRLSDPGSGRQLFTRVYDRGAMAVHATRVAMGDAAFFPFFRAWAQQRGPRSLELWRDQAQQASPVDLRPLFAAWLDGTEKVPPRPEYGFR
jgi:aminopeptidase N